MKPRKREVEIFNMSLLDILCGALGAFCFMMLALFPDYVHARKAGITVKTAAQKAQDAEKKEKWAKVRHDVGVAAIAIHWDSAHDIDLYIQTEGGPWLGPKKLASMKDEDVLASDQKSAGSESAFYRPGNVRIMYRVADTNGASGKATVYGFASSRTGLFADASGLTIALPAVELGERGETVVAELKWDRFSPEAVLFRRTGS
ncbi:MAG: hypothetical protein U0Q12_01915 [Vicinamibacterales bacterium]